MPIGYQPINYQNWIKSNPYSYTLFYPSSFYSTSSSSSQIPSSNDYYYSFDSHHSEAELQNHINLGIETNGKNFNVITRLIMLMVLMFANVWVKTCD